MNTRQKAIAFGLLMFATQGATVVALRFSRIALPLERLLILAVFIGVMVSLMHIMLRMVRAGAEPEILWVAMIFIIVSFLVLETASPGRVFPLSLPLLLGVATFLTGVAIAYDAHDLQGESGGKESYPLLFATLAAPQLCTSAVVAGLLIHNL